MANIINIQHYSDALRNTGYKNVESAIAEIVDNSIEAEASDILIICTLDSSSGRQVVKEIAILDNGKGMDKETIENCLVIGESTRRSRKGMGRFGVGLPQASLHVCPRVEVYSWQKADNVRTVYLDVDQIKEGKQKEIEESQEVGLPAVYLKYFEDLSFKDRAMKFEKSGTLVVWKNCDRLRPKTVAPLFERFKFLLGRKFRYFIHSNYCNIGFAVSNTDQYDQLLRPNDPLNLMADNQVLGEPEDPKNIKDAGEPLFELWDNGDILGTVTLPINYLDKQRQKQSSEISITFSWSKEIYQAQTGSHSIGKFLKRNVGISVIRANREIDYGKFDFFEDVNEPEHRWWGCEIRFEPELDEVFGVANNKQQVELFALDIEDYQEEEIKPIWFILNDLIGREIKMIRNRLKSRMKSTRSNGKSTTQSPEESLVDGIEKKNPAETASRYFRESQKEDALREMARQRLNDAGIPDPSDEEITTALKVEVKLEFKDLGDNSQFIDINTRMGNCWLTINTGSIFYREIYSKIENQDEATKRAFNLLLMAFARAEDEAYSSTELYHAFTDVREHWGMKLRKYLREDYQS